MEFLNTKTSDSCNRACSLSFGMWPTHDYHTIEEGMGPSVPSDILGICTFRQIDKSVESSQFLLTQETCN